MQETFTWIFRDVSDERAKLSVEDFELGTIMPKLTVQNRDSALAKSTAISKRFWYGALLSIIGLAGFVAKVNPGKPISATTSKSSATTPGSTTLSGGYDIVSPTLSAPPNSSTSPQQSAGQNPVQRQSSGPAVSATGAS